MVKSLKDGGCAKDSGIDQIFLGVRGVVVELTKGELES